MSNNVEEVTENDGTSSSGVPMEKVTKRVKKRVKGWLETEVWNPVRKYMVAVIGGFATLIIIIIVAKIIHRAKITKLCKSDRKPITKDPKQVYIIRRPKKTDTSEANPESFV